MECWSTANSAHCLLFTHEVCELKAQGVSSVAEFDPEFDVTLITCCVVDPTNSRPLHNQMQTPSCTIPTIKACSKRLFKRFQYTLPLCKTLKRMGVHAHDSPRLRGRRQHPIHKIGKRRRVLLGWPMWRREPAASDSPTLPLSFFLPPRSRNVAHGSSAHLTTHGNVLMRMILETGSVDCFCVVPSSRASDWFTYPIPSWQSLLSWKMVTGVSKSLGSSVEGAENIFCEVYVLNAASAVSLKFSWLSPRSGSSRI